MFKIRKCEVQDVPAVGGFYDRIVYDLVHHINYPQWMYKVYPSVGSVKEDVATGNQFACYDGDRICGAFVINSDPKGSYGKARWKRQLKQGQYLVIHSLAADDKQLHQGIGSAMVRYCIDYAKRHGFQAIRLDVVPDNTPARRLYEKFGFCYAGDVDLERGITTIPSFSMYELNL
ncbi:GNAT family N-acetyltransferase [Prevotella cerevisiae]|uniref:GNAT family N-acetyltransferase n=1 Tax=Segatella cerevisiae TaxID=2053716 RepID=A0ABT1BUX3_9BACT|nr:GNAT family N-acetyltransferase [Segatella cerevisiae]MCO6024894.1 GNAT family N-acetyltransferase [Segatella cerevisiae]